MNLSIAIIRPNRLEGVRTALDEQGVSGLTVTEVNGYGRQQGRHELYRGAEYQLDYVPKIKLEVAVIQEQVEKILEAICNVAGSGQIGDGKIFVLPLSQVIRLRTGELTQYAL